MGLQHALFDSLTHASIVASGHAQHMTAVTFMLPSLALAQAHRAVENVLHAGHQHGLALGAPVRIVAHDVAELAGDHLCAQARLCISLGRSIQSGVMWTSSIG